MRSLKLKLIPALACVLLVAGCGEQPPAEKPPEARATPKLVPNAPEPVEDPHAGHDHGPGDGHNHGPGGAHVHEHAASPSPAPSDTPTPLKPEAASPAPSKIPMHGYSPDGKPSK